MTDADCLMIEYALDTSRNRITKTVSSLLLVLNLSLHRLKPGTSSGAGSSSSLSSKVRLVRVDPEVQCLHRSGSPGILSWIGTMKALAKW